MTLCTYDDIGFITADMDCGCTLVWKEEHCSPHHMIDDKIVYRLQFNPSNKAFLSTDWENYLRHHKELLKILSIKQFEEWIIGFAAHKKNIITT